MKKQYCHRFLPFLVIGLTISAAGVAVAANGGSAVGTQYSDVYISISDVTVSPETPETGELVTVTVTIQNRQSSDESVDINEVELIRQESEGKSRVHLGTVKDLGTLPPGSTTTVPVAISFETPGVHTLEVRATTENDDEDTFEVKRPVVIQVQEEKPLIDVAAPDAVAGSETGVTASVSNGRDEPIRNLQLTVQGEALTVSDHPTSKARLPGGETVDFDFTVIADDPGVHEMNVTLSYTTAQGIRRSTTRIVDVAFEALEDDVVIQTGQEGSSKIAVTVTNRGNVPLDKVSVTGNSSDASVSTALTDEVPARSSRTVRLNVTEFDARANVTVQVTYQIGQQTKTSESTVTVSGDEANVTLTGIDIRHEDGKVHIVGSAGNLGSEQATATIVKVVSTEHVSPAYPGREFFVGTVPPSDFLSFDLYAHVDTQATEIQLEVTYHDGTMEKKEVVTIPYTPPESGDETIFSDTRVVYATMGIGLLSILGLMGIAWRRSDGRH